MKKILLAAFCALACFLTSHAQGYAIVVTKYILDRMYKDFDAERVMLSDTLKRKREDQLFNMEKEVRDLQRKRFGYEGDLFKLRQDLVKPVQDKVYNAIQKIAVNRMYDL